MTKKVLPDKRDKLKTWVKRIRCVSYSRNFPKAAKSVWRKLALTVRFATVVEMRLVSNAGEKKGDLQNETI